MQAKTGCFQIFAIDEHGQSRDEAIFCSPGILVGWYYEDELFSR